jgi:hypothetical protein
MMNGGKEKVPVQPSTGFSIYQIFIKNGLDILTLSDESGVDAYVVWDVLLNNPHPVQVEAQLLAAINRLKGTHYGV